MNTWELGGAPTGDDHLGIIYEYMISTKLSTRMLAFCTIHYSQSVIAERLRIGSTRSENSVVSLWTAIAMQQNATDASL